MERPYDTYENSIYTLQSAEPEAGDLDPLALADRLVRETGVNIFLTGKAGTGKTTFLRRLSETINKRMVVLAPTGVAAINAGGATIHSFFQLSFAPFIPGYGFASDEKKRFSFNKTKRRIIRTLDLLVIDEISMVRPDVLDAVDDVLRRYRNPRLPFGGVQLLLIGDLRQLSPVVKPQEWQLLSPHYRTPYFFESIALRQAGFVTVELTKVFRQQDSTFIDILNKIRDNKADSQTLEILNRRAIPPLSGLDEDGIIRLTTHNYRADQINARRMAALERDEFIYDAVVQGTFPQSSFPADEHLVLKVGAQVMFIKNDPGLGKEYYNGLIGTVSNLSTDTVYVLTHEDPPREIAVGRVDWENTRYTLNESTGQITEEREGLFSQIPLRLAWAITIHKSQGLTFDRAIIDAAHSFAPGQTYVALSRCRSLDGLYLDSPLPTSAIMTDGAVSNFINSQKQRVPDNNTVDYFRSRYYASLLHELFDFTALVRAFDNLHHLIETEMHRLYPVLTKQADTIKERLQNEVCGVSARLYSLIDSTAPFKDTNEEASQLLNGKVAGGCTYFCRYMTDVLNWAKLIPVTLDNKAVVARLTQYIEEVMEATAIKIELLRAFESDTFDTTSYLAKKADTLLRIDSGNKTPKRRATTHLTSRKNLTKANARSINAEPEEISAEFPSSSDSDIVNPHIYERLRRWRNEKAIQLGNIPAYSILSNRALMGLSATLPASLEEMAEIKGFGKVKLRKFGEELLEILSTDNS